MMQTTTDAPKAWRLLEMMRRAFVERFERPARTRAPASTRTEEPPAEKRRSMQRRAPCGGLVKDPHKIYLA